jgi:hypothetical protein
MEGMRLIATYVGPYGTTTCSQCREQLEPGERIFGDADTAHIYCIRCARIDGSDG